MTRKSPVKVAGAVSANVPFPVVALRPANVPVTVCAEELPPEALWSCVPAIVPAVADVFAKVTEPEISVTGDVAGAEVPRTNVELRSEALRLSGEGD